MKRVRSALLVPLLACTLRGQGIVTTVAGTEFVFPDSGLSALNAPLGRVRDVAPDRQGGFFVADEGNRMVMRIGPEGMLTVFAGNGFAAFSGDGGPARNASLRAPFGLALDAQDNLYIVDSADHRVRRVTTDGTISTFAGNGRSGSAGDNGPAAAAQLNQPQGIAIDPGGSVYIADTFNHKIRRVAPDGTITTFAGTGERGISGDTGPAVAARLNFPVAVEIDPAGNVLIGSIDSVRRVGTDGRISLLASRAGNGLAVDARGVIAASSSDNTVFRIGDNGQTTTIGGSSQAGFSGDGGSALAAQLNSPAGIAVDSSGRLLIADLGNQRVRRIAGTTIDTAAGNGRFRFSGDGGVAASATFNTPSGVAIDPRGGFAIADLGNHRIRAIDSSGLVATLAGTGTAAATGDNGPATSATLNFPEGIAVDASGTIFVADRGNGAVRSISPSGTIRRVIGGLRFPYAVAVDGRGNVFVTDSEADRVLRVDAAGIATTVAGGGGGGLGDNGPATQATLASPRGLVVDPGGALYIADSGNDRVRRVANGVITTFAGGGSSLAEGVAATTARLSQPRGLALDPAGNLYVTEVQGHKVRRISTAGVIATVAGTGAGGFAGDGGPAVAAQLNLPTGVAIDATGNVLIADSGNHRIRAVLAAPPPVTTNVRSLAFTAQSLGIPTPPRILGVSSPAVGLRYTVEATPGWLNATPRTGGLPAAIEVVADPSSLQPGTYSGRVTVLTPDGVPPRSEIPVTFEVQPPRQPSETISPRELFFAFLPQTAPRSQRLTVANQGGGQLDFTAAVQTDSGGDWLTVTPRAASATPGQPVTLTVTASPGTLRPGSYAGAVLINVLGRTLPVPVTLTVTEVEQFIRLSQAGVGFSVVQGGGLAPPQEVAVLNAGRGSLSWTAEASVLSGTQGWLSVTPASGTSDAAATDAPRLRIQVNPAGLAPGEYFGQIEVRSRTALNSPQYVSVGLEVLPPGADPGPQIQPAELIFSAVSGDVPPGSQEVFVYNPIATPLAYRSRVTTENGADWVSHLPTDASVPSDRPTRIAIQPNIAPLAPGVYRATLALSFSDGFTRKVGVLAVVLAPAAGSSSLRAAQAECTARALLPVLVSAPPDLQSPAAFPKPIVVDVRDDCGRPIGSGAVLVEFDSGDAPVSLVSLERGLWSATWRPLGTAARTVNMTITARAPELGLAGRRTVSLDLRSSQERTPIVSEGGVVMAATPGLRSPVAPGSIVSIFGQSLADEFAVSPALPLPNDLSGTRVVMAGRDVPLVAVSQNQVNAVLPYGIPSGSTQQIVVRRGRLPSVPIPVTIVSARPAIFTENQGGTGQGIVVDQAGRVVRPGNGAASGDAVVIYCAGLGEVDREVGAADPAPGSPPASAREPVSVTIGGRPARVLFAGLTPGFAGLHQVNVVIPDGVPGGDQVPVILTAGTQQSAPATMAIR